jgi:hypothetical protein
VVAGSSAERLRPDSQLANTRPCNGAPGPSASRQSRSMSAPVSSAAPGQASTHESHAALVERYTKGVALDHTYRRMLAAARREQLNLVRLHRRMQAMSARGPKPHDASQAIGPVLHVGIARMHIPNKVTRQNKNPAYAPPTGSLVGELSPGKRLLEDRLLMLQGARNMDEGVQLAEQLTRARVLSVAGGGPSTRVATCTWAAFAIDPAATPATLAVGAGLDFECGKSSGFTGEDTFYTSVPAPVSVDPAGSAGADAKPGSPIAPYLAAARAAEEEACQVSRAVEEQSAPQGWQEESAPQGWTPAVQLYDDAEAPAAWASAWEGSAASPVHDSTSFRTSTWYASEPVPLPDEAPPPPDTQRCDSEQRRSAGRPTSPPSRLSAVAARPSSAAARPGSAASRHTSAASRIGSAASRPASAASRPGSAVARPASAASRPASAASRPGSAVARLGSAARSPGSAAPRLQGFAEDSHRLHVDPP